MQNQNEILNSQQEEHSPLFYCVVLKKRKAYYFLAADKKSVTRNAKEAYLYSALEGRTKYGCIAQAKENIKPPSGYSFYSLFSQRTAQETLDENYPLPRKAIPKKTRKEVFLKFNGRCAYCGCQIDYKHMRVDHVVSHMLNKGTDEFSNYYPSCKDCNHFKMCSSVERFRKNIKDTIRTCSRRSKNFLWDRIYRKYGLDIDPYKPVEFYFEKYTQE